MGNAYLLSLCIPTDGISDWVFPVLDSIYSQKVDERLFEVVVSDNGNDSDFKSMMEEYGKNHSNLVYVKTDAVMFHNQIEALKAGSGEYLQFVNHRFALSNGGLEYLLEFVRKNRDTMPVAYFSLGKLGTWNGAKEFDNFDKFVYCLGNMVSWTSGVGVWKKKFEKIPACAKVDDISPHSHILFCDRNNARYIVDNTILAHEIDLDQTRKGKYDLFKAFAVDEVTIALNLYADGSISADTLKKVRLGYRNYVSECYFHFILRKKPCSYDISGFEDAMGIIFSKWEIFLGVVPIAVGKAYRKSKRILGNLIKTNIKVKNDNI